MEEKQINLCLYNKKSFDSFVRSVFFSNFGIKTNTMRIIAKRTLVEYYTKNPKSKTALESWYETTSKAEWRCFADIQNDFATVSSVGNHRYVFNIKGNDYRLIVLIKFTISHVLIRFVGTHEE